MTLQLKTFCYFKDMNHSVLPHEGSEVYTTMVGENRFVNSSKRRRLPVPDKACTAQT